MSNFVPCPMCNAGSIIADLERALAEALARAAAAEEERDTHRAARASAEVRAERAEAESTAAVERLGEVITERDRYRRDLVAMIDDARALAAKYGGTL